MNHMLKILASAFNKFKLKINVIKPKQYSEIKRTKNRKKAYKHILHSTIIKLIWTYEI